MLADTLSRSPTGPTVISASEEEVVFQLQIIKEHEFLLNSDQRIAAIKSAAARDTEYAMLSKIVKPSSGSSLELLELQRNHDGPGWDCLQRRASG